MMVFYEKKGLYTGLIFINKKQKIRKTNEFSSVFGPKKLLFFKKDDDIPVYKKKINGTDTIVLL